MSNTARSRSLSGVNTNSCSSPPLRPRTASANSSTWPGTRGGDGDRGGQAQPRVAKGAATPRARQPALPPVGARPGGRAARASQPRAAMRHCVLGTRRQARRGGPACLVVRDAHAQQRGGKAVAGLAEVQQRDVLQKEGPRWRDEGPRWRGVEQEQGVRAAGRGNALAPEVQRPPCRRPRRRRLTQRGLMGEISLCSMPTRSG